MRSRNVIWFGNDEFHATKSIFQWYACILLADERSASDFVITCI